MRILFYQISMNGTDKVSPPNKKGLPSLLPSRATALPVNSENRRLLMNPKLYFFLIFFAEPWRRRFLSLNNLDMSFCLLVGLSLAMVIFFKLFLYIILQL